MERLLHEPVEFTSFCISIQEPGVLNTLKRTEANDSDFSPQGSRRVVIHRLRRSIIRLKDVLHLRAIRDETEAVLATERVGQVRFVALLQEQKRPSAGGTTRPPPPPHVTKTHR